MTRNKNNLYEAPKATDLFNLGVEGKGPMGECISGQYPYYSCGLGTVYFATCVDGPTADTSSCETGAVHTDPACKNGTKATTRCWSGQGQNF